MEAIKRLAIGNNFQPIDEKYTTAIVGRWGAELDGEGEKYCFIDFDDSINVEGADEVSIEKYNDFITFYTKEVHGEAVKAAIAQLAEIEAQLAPLLNKGIELAQVAGINWEVPVGKHYFEPAKLEYVDWQSSTIECAMY